LAKSDQKDKEPTPSKGGEAAGRPGEGPPAEGAAPPEPSPEAKREADEWFDRAEQAAVRGNYDYAIRCFLEGLRRSLGDVQRGHKGLYDAAVKRRGQGKGAGLGSLLSQGKAAFSQMLGRHKDSMLGLEAALAKDPQNVMVLAQLMQVARRVDLAEVAIFFGELAAEESLRGRKKPQKQIFTTLADLYESQGDYRQSIEALQQAVKIDPADRGLDKRMRDLAARASIEEGKLESVSDFHDMIRDRRAAADAATQKVIRTREQLDAQYEQLKAALDADPKNPVKMQAVAECQWRRGNTDEAMALLQHALDLTRDYRYKVAMDDIRMAEYRRQLRQLAEQLETATEQADLKTRQKQLLQQRDALELDIFQERHRQYPTDLAIRFELGVRQYRAGRLDEAIVSFQQATRDPKRRVQATNMLGRCFYAKKLYQEAQGQFEAAIHQYELTGDPLSKELRYNLATTLETQGKIKEAVEWYSDIVQQDYQYRDAAKRLEALRRHLAKDSAEAQ
jgi:tetratricopeptide (TPR) repeat protein